MAHFFIKIIKDFVKFCLTLALWGVVFYSLMMAYSYGGEQHYENNQAIDPRFRVLVHGQGQHIYSMLLHDFQENNANNQLVKYNANASWDGGENWNRLTQISPEVFELHTDLDTAMFSQRYRITPNNQVEPISFREIANPFSFMILFFLSFPIFAIILWSLKKMVARLDKRVAS